MRTLLLGFAAPLAALLLSTAAQGQMAGDSTLQARSGHHGGHDGRHHRRVRDDNVFVSYGGEWARYNNRTFEPDSFNDWWHDRPDRAFPRWVQHNQNCSPDRQWWSGNGWHC